MVNRGRPKKLEKEKLSSSYRLRMSASQKAILKEFAEYDGITEADFIRRAILSYMIRSRKPVELWIVTEIVDDDVWSGIHYHDILGVFSSEEEARKVQEDRIGEHAKDVIAGVSHDYDDDAFAVVIENYILNQVYTESRAYGEIL